MKRIPLLVFSAAVCGTVLADPVVTLNQFSCSRAADKVKIVYTLGNEPAVVTMRLKRGDATVNPCLFANAEGDVNRLVSVGSNKKIVWIPPSDFDFGDRNEFSVELTAWKTDAPPPYMVVNLTNSPVTVNYYVSTNDFPLGFGHLHYKSAALTMRKIPVANQVYDMGNEAYMADRSVYRTATTAHRVKLSEDFYIGVYEYTYGNRKAAKGESVASPSTDWPGNDCKPSDSRDYPMLACSYTSVRDAGNAKETGWPAQAHQLASETSYLAVLRNRTGIDFDLPTEAQWYRACLGDGSTPFYNGRGDGSQLRLSKVVSGLYCFSGLDQYAWTAENARTDEGRYVPHPVGLKRPNSYGLYDLLGNALEWVLDAAKGSDYAEKGVALSTDPVGSTDPDMTGAYPKRIRLGGGYVNRGDVMQGTRLGQVATYTAYSGQTGVSDQSKVENWTQGFRVACPAQAVK